MAPTKPSPLKAIRKQAAAHSRSMAAASAGSAFSALTRSNQEVKYGFKRTYDDLDGNEQEVYTEPVRKRMKKATPEKTTKPKQTCAAPRPPVIEAWRPAGGERPTVTKRRKPEKLTDTLGLARLSTWRVAAFQEAAEQLIEQHGLAFEEVNTKEVVHGDESVTDVFVKFRSELVAEAVKEKIDGEVVGGRKVQVRFA
ncbi:hypothetical protein LTR85_007764 [Meristemomyces frigidus]|nr:hypothetical protein LTR85_007764 [Meristemomyces frigidus]